MDVAVVAFVVLVIALMYLASKNARHGATLKADALRDEMKVAKMYARLYDDPDFIKDMDLTDEERKYL